MDVIPLKDLVERPELYEPLSSYKSVRNLESKHRYNNLDMNQLFLDKNNIFTQANRFYTIHRNNGGRSKFNKIYELIRQNSKLFAKNNNLNSYITADVEVTGQIDWVEALKAVNRDFINNCKNLMQWNTFVPTREWAEVGPKSNRVQKKFHEMTADDAKTLDVWQKQEVAVMAKFFRDNNKIPFYQHTMSRRHYDRGNEGLHAADADRASLSNYVPHTYDMRDVVSTLDKWKSDEWFGV